MLYFAESLAYHTAYAKYDALREATLLAINTPIHKELNARTDAAWHEVNKATAAELIASGDNAQEKRALAQRVS